MRHFIVELSFRQPMETFGEAVGRHRSFLQQAYDSGKLLISGPRVDKTGGLIVARGESENEIRQLFADDPYKVEGLADYAFTEFTPTKAQPLLADWVD